MGAHYTPPKSRGILINCGKVYSRWRRRKAQHLKPASCYETNMSVCGPCYGKKNELRYPGMLSSDACICRSNRRIVSTKKRHHHHQPPNPISLKDPRTTFVILYFPNHRLHRTQMTLSKGRTYQNLLPCYKVSGI
jgi:hypothetical protein